MFIFLASLVLVATTALVVVRRAVRAWRRADRIVSEAEAVLSRDCAPAHAVVVTQLLDRQDHRLLPPMP